MEHKEKHNGWYLLDNILQYNSIPDGDNLAEEDMKILALAHYLNIARTKIVHYLNTHGYTKEGKLLRYWHYENWYNGEPIKHRIELRANFCLEGPDEELEEYTDYFFATLEEAKLKGEKLFQDALQNPKKYFGKSAEGYMFIDTALYSYADDININTMYLFKRIDNTKGKNEREIQ